MVLFFKLFFESESFTCTISSLQSPSAKFNSRVSLNSQTYTQQASKHLTNRRFISKKRSLPTFITENLLNFH